MLYCLLASFWRANLVRSSHIALPKACALGFSALGRRKAFSPKAEQQRFIDRVFGKEQIVMLQGPPGTGKTETLQLAVLAHVAAHRATSQVQGFDGCSHPQSHPRICQ